MMSRFSTRMPKPTVIPLWPTATENVNCRRSYEERIREVEHGSFTPLIFSTQGGMSKVTTTMYKRLASLISTKKSQPYSKTMNWIRCLIRFALLRATNLYLRGARSSANQAVRSNVADTSYIIIRYIISSLLVYSWKAVRMCA